LREEIERSKRRLLLAACAAALLHFAALLAIVLVAVIFWDTYRVASIAAMAIACLVGAAAFLWTLRVELAAKPAAFAASLAELEQDMHDLRLHR